MKKTLAIICFFISQFTFAQIPQSFKYQAVVRDATGLLAVNKIISIRTSILSGSASGSSVYIETQTLSTNDYGVVSLNIGAGALVSGNFSTINWGATTYFVKTELDINGASTYVFMGTSQILSVPYALYAEKTGSSLSDNDTSATNELQALSVAGNTLSISSGNSIALPPDGDSNPSNELQSLSITGDSLHITSGNSVYLSGSVDLDASPTNEIQNLSLSGDSLKISMGNNIVFPHDNDRDSINEIQNLYINNDTIKISKSNFIVLPPNYDNDSTNEFQTLSLNQGSLTISNRNTVHLPDSTSSNELQNLSISQDSISITQGNTIYINTTRSFKFPEGIDGTPFMLYTNSAYSYTVPAGKNLYLTTTNYQGIGQSVFPPGTILTGSGVVIAGVLVNPRPDIQIVNVSVNSLGGTYTVPSGKTLYIKSVTNSYVLYGSIGGVNYNIDITSPFNEPLIVPSGTVLYTQVPSGGTYTTCSFTGYLK